MRRRQWSSRLRSMLSGAVLLALGLSSMASPLSLEPFAITPGLILEERFDADISLEPSHERDDFISYGAFNLRVGLPLQFSQTRTITPFLAYSAEASAFAKHSQENFQHQGLIGGVNFDLPLMRPAERLTFNASNRFRTVTEVSSSAEQSDMGPRGNRAENVLSADLGYFLTRRDEFHLAYDRLDLDQRHVTQFLDRNQNLISLTYLRRLRATFSGLLEYAYHWVDFTNRGPDDPDFSSRTHRIAIGIRGDPDARLSGIFKIGAGSRQLNRVGKSTHPFVSGDLTYRLTSKLRINLLASKAMLESSNQNFSAYDATITRLRLTQQLSPRLSSFFEGGMELDAFTDHRETRTDGPVKRVDRLYEIGLGIEYAFARWLTTSFSYLYRTKNSNVTTLDYVDNRAMLRIAIRF
jgi:Putative beta-barrel porin 2